MRWFLSGGILCLLAAATASALALNAGSGRPTTPTATALVSALRGGDGVSGYSGTLVAQMSLELPVSGSRGAGGSPILLMAGAHTMRYWYGGVDRQRVALIGAHHEADVFYTGSSIWQWDSATNVATRSTLPPSATMALGSPLFPAPLTYAALTPEQLARRSVAAVDTRTHASVRSGPRIAGRRTYELTLRPDHREATRIAAVRIDVDAARDVPLGVHVYARGQRKPSIGVSFSSITYRAPGAEYFVFRPPPGATVHRGVSPQLVSRPQRDTAAVTALSSRSEDTGWSAITAFQLRDAGAAVGAPLRTAMVPVSGQWGHGYLLDTPLLCVLVTADGQVLSGSVDPAGLYAVA